MKATIDIPDALYRRVQARSALAGRSVREVTVALLEGWLGRGSRGDASPRATPDEWLLDDGKPAPVWFGLARAHMRSGVDHGWSAVRESIGRGWAQEVAEREAAIRRTVKRVRKVAR